MEGELLQAVKGAVRQTVAAIGARRPGDSLAGYALLTDDSLTTLTYTAVTKEALTLSGADDLLFSPTDWPWDESSSFEPASQRLRATGAASDSPEHVNAAFATLVQALADLQAEGIFSREVFLSVLSTDPSPHLEALERASVERLNHPDLVEARERFLEKWTH
jgi:hypothetical protein